MEPGDFSPAGPVEERASRQSLEQLDDRSDSRGPSRAGRMNTAVDTSVLLSIIKQEAGWETWSEKLRWAAGEGRLLVCPVVFAELSSQFPTVDVLLSTLHEAGIEYDPFSSEAAHLAGQMFQAYRSRGGPRDQLIPDFLIAAHGQLQAGRLAAIDRGYYRRCFKGLRLLQA